MENLEINLLDPYQKQLGRKNLEKMFLDAIEIKADIVKLLIAPKKEQKWLIEKNEQGETMVRFSNLTIGFIYKIHSSYYLVEGYLAQKHIGNNNFSDLYYEWYSKSKIKSELIEN